MVLNLFLMSIFFFLILGLGYTFAKSILKENKLIYLIPFSVCFGSSFFVTILHLFSFLFAVPKATYISLIFILILSLFILYKHKSSQQLELGLPKIKFLLLLSFSLLLGFLSLAYLLKFSTYDPGVYQIIGLMSKLDYYPSQNPYGADTPNIYHNGVILLASALKTFTKLETFDSLTPIQALFIFIFPMGIFSLLFSITRNFKQAIFGTIISCFCASLKSLELFTFFVPDILNKLINDFRHTLFWMADSGFVNPTQKALISPNSSVALPLSVFLFYLCLKETSIDKKLYLPIFFTSAYLFSCYEAYWLPVVMAFFVYQAILTVQNTLNKKQLFALLILVCLITGGPILSSGVFLNKNENISKLLYIDVKPYALSFGGTMQFVYPPTWFKNKSNFILSEANNNILYKVPIFSKYMFHEFGLPLVILPFIILWLLITKNLRLMVFLLAGIISFTIPFLVTYYLMEVETHRFFIYSRFIFSALFGVFLGFLINIKLPSSINISLPLFKNIKFTPQKNIQLFSLIDNILYRTFLILLIVTLVLPGILWLVPIYLPHYEYRAVKLHNADKKALSWLSKNSKSGDRGIGPWDIPFKYFELISLAGIYGTGVYRQHIAQEETRRTALTTLNPCLLEELKTKWIYLNKNLDEHAHAVIPQDITDLYSLVPKDVLKKLVKEKLLILRYKYKSNEELRLIYEFIPPKDNLYCKNKNYTWSIGHLTKGKFNTLQSKSQTTFLNKTSALNKLKEITSSLDKKEVMWYGVEAIKI